MRAHDLRGAGDAARAGQVFDHYWLAQRLGQAIADGADGAIGPRARRQRQDDAQGPVAQALGPHQAHGCQRCSAQGSRAKAQGAAPDGRCQRGRCFAVASTGVPRACGLEGGCRHGLVSVVVVNQGLAGLCLPVVPARCTGPLYLPVVPLRPRRLPAAAPAPARACSPALASGPPCAGLAPGAAGARPGAGRPWPGAAAWCGRFARRARHRAG